VQRRGAISRQITEPAVPALNTIGYMLCINTTAITCSTTVKGIVHYLQLYHCDSLTSRDGAGYTLPCCHVVIFQAYHMCLESVLFSLHATAVMFLAPLS